ncbi:MAG: sigma-54-dependent Fis family transcriptional regulator [Planctomycetes bacterium]|nr:sigma-54-dependent Fis family transcriptional regulator [Planctomycetota bacterium]
MNKNNRVPSQNPTGIQVPPGIPGAVTALFSAGDRAFASFMLGKLADHRAETVEQTYKHYVEQFGEDRTLTDVEFRLLFRKTVDSICLVKTEPDAQQFLSRCSEFGETLASRNVPLGEFVITLQFFEDACLSAPGIQQDVRSHRAFDRLSHQLIASVASGYYTRQSGEQAALRASLERDISRLAPEARTVFHGLVGRSVAMRKLFAKLSASAPRRTTLLLVGETGTGKELCARAIHDLSERKNGPFVPVNCAAIPREILASELFGHRRGAFTGAVQDSKGLIAAAEKGTLFLDEVTEMDEAAQVALLRVLEMHTIRPIGATGERAVDIRFVAATNRDPEDAVAQGKLRVDLFHRLSATMIEVPPMRERMEDLELLVDYFLIRIARSERIQNLQLGKGVLEALRSYNWPGNIRELANCLESAATFCNESIIEVADIPERVTRARASAPPLDPARELDLTKTSAAAAQTPPVPLEIATPGGGITTVREQEYDLIRRGLDAHHGNKAATARALGISRKRLYAKLREMGIVSEIEKDEEEE